MKEPGIDDRPRRRFIVAIPVRNEAERIGPCLAALSRQSGIAPGTLGVVLFLNACTDNTMAVVDAQSCGLPFTLRVIEGQSDRPSAGWARRMAMEAALAWLDEAEFADGVLLTSDADSRVGDDWVALNVAAIAAGADAVAGRIALDPVEAAALPKRLHVRGRLESSYEALLTEIGARIDPEPGNPWPCHWSRSGATIAVRASTYRAVGGIPKIECGEDRAFVDAVRSAGFVVRHAPDIEVITSGRLDGRAVGGVADTIKLRCERPQAPCDDRLEPLRCFIVRSVIARMLRKRYAAQTNGPIWPWAFALNLPHATTRALLNMPLYAARASIEAASPRLVCRPLTPVKLPRQIWLAELVASVLRALVHRRPAAGRADSAVSAPLTSLPRRAPRLP